MRLLSIVPPIAPATPPMMSCINNSGLEACVNQCAPLPMSETTKPKTISVPTTCAGANLYNYSLNTSVAWPGRHNSSANFLAADGHVKYISGLNVSTGWNASSPTSAQTAGARAEGTGVGTHTMTFSAT